MTAYAYGQMNRDGGYSPIEVAYPKPKADPIINGNLQGLIQIAHTPFETWAYERAFYAPPPWGQLWPTTR